MPYLNILTIKEWCTRFITGFVVISILSACGLLGDKHEKDYLKSNTIAPITVPDGLQQPVNRDPINIPFVADDYAPAEDIIVPPPLTNEEVKLAIVESTSSSKPPEDETATPKVDFTSIKSEIQTDTNFEVSLLVEEKFDVVWNRVAQALASLGFVIEDKNQLTQFYTVYKQIIKIDFEQDDISKPTELELEKSPDREYYKIKVSEAMKADGPEAKTRIQVLDRTGDSLGSDLDKHLLAQIKAQFETPPKKNNADRGG